MASGSIPSSYTNTVGTLTPGDDITINRSSVVRAENVVTIYAELSGDFPANTTLATLPEGFRPKQAQFIMCLFPFNNEEKLFRCNVGSNGAIRLLYSNTHIESCLFFGTIVL